MLLPVSGQVIVGKKPPIGKTDSLCRFTCSVKGECVPACRYCNIQIIWQICSNRQRYEFREYDILIHIKCVEMWCPSGVSVGSISILQIIYKVCSFDMLNTWLQVQTVAPNIEQGREQKSFLSDSFTVSPGREERLTTAHISYPLSCAWCRN